MKRTIALLLLTVMMFSLTGCGEKQEQTSAVKPLAEAVYPEMVPYPDAETYGDGDAYWAAYEAWRKGQSDRRSGGKPERVQAFQSATMGQLLGETGGENKVYSPANLYMALSMLAELTDGESRAQILQLLKIFPISAASLGLGRGFLIPIQPQPQKILPKLKRVFLPGTLGIQILHPQHHSAALTADRQPCQHGRKHIAKVHPSGGRWGKPSHRAAHR